MQILPCAGTHAGGTVNIVFTIFMRPAQAILPVPHALDVDRSARKPGNRNFAMAEEIDAPTRSPIYAGYSRFSRLQCPSGTFPMFSNAFSDVSRTEGTIQ